MTYLGKLIVLIVFLISHKAASIVIRHDVDDKHYQELAKHYSPTMAYINGCSTTLISSTWLLTAAHCVIGREHLLLSAQYLENRYRIGKIFVHPKYRNNNISAGFDMALLQLRDPVLNGKPASLYSNRDEQGIEVVFVGRGQYGNGRKGIIKDDSIQRAATNTVTSVSQQWLRFNFDNLVSATALEGISGPGDSGGPAFIEANSKLYIAGVSSWQERYGQPEGTYNVTEHYTRVSSNIDWLNSTMKQPELAPLPKHPVIDAVRNGNVTQFRKVVKNNKGWMLNTAILEEAVHQTVLHNHLPVMEELIDAGVPVESIKIKQLSLFELALFENRKEYFVSLLKKTRFLKNIHKKNSIILTLIINNFTNDKRLIELVDLALLQGANIGALTPQGNTALLVSGWDTDNLGLVELLIERGGNVNVANENGYTPLMGAAYLGKIDLLNYLLANGADPNLKNKNSKTALDLAKSNKRKKIVKILRVND